ncbi:MAG: hypothetical protein AB7E73_02710 [Burkholderiales bacterium]
MDQRPVILAAGDDGPRNTLRPLAGAIPVIASGDNIPPPVDEIYWHQLTSAHNPRGLVCGTSDSPAGQAVEAGARRAAAAAGIPIAVVEDFPGNYREVAGSSTGLLLVESPPAIELARNRLGTSCPPTRALSPARYDPYRLQACARRTTIRQAWTGNSKPSVLWAGQPETTDCLLTLEALRPVLADLRLQLLFKAHPRDAGYAGGAYRGLLSDPALSPVDVTPLPVEDALLLAPRLVITQFSSVAIEAGFCGIPSLNLLLPGAGADRLLEKKSCVVPPHCLEGAALHTHDPAALTGMIRSGIADESLRTCIVRCFDSYFSVGTPTLPAFIRILEDLFASREISP